MYVYIQEFSESTAVVRGDNFVDQKSSITLRAIYILLLL